MAKGFPIDAAQIVALFIESVFFGVYLVTFGMVMRVLLNNMSTYTSQRLHLVFLAVALALFLFAVLDEAIQVQRVLEAFIWYTGSGGAIVYFGKISNWLSVAKLVIYSSQTSLADGMLIYRCYIVYGRNLWVFFGLSILWVTGFVVEIYSVIIEATFRADALVSTDALKPWFTSLFAISLGLNLIATSLIAIKIWQVQRQNAGFLVSDSSALMRAMWIVIESGVLYSLGVVILMIVYLTQNNAAYGVSDVIVQIIGISFNLIIIRISQGRSIESTLAETQSRADNTKRRGFKPSRPRFHIRSHSFDVSDLSSKRGDTAIVVQFTKESITDADLNLDAREEV